MMHKWELRLFLPPHMFCRGTSPGMLTSRHFLPFSKDTMGKSREPATSEVITFTFQPQYEGKCSQHLPTALKVTRGSVAQWLHETKSLRVEKFVLPEASSMSGQRMDRECKRKIMAHWHYLISVCLLLMCLASLGTFLSSTHQGTMEEKKEEEKRRGKRRRRKKRRRTETNIY